MIYKREDFRGLKSRKSYHYKVESKAETKQRLDKVKFIYVRVG